MKKTVVFDFDGVIHAYTSGWKGHDIIPDPIVPGVAEAIRELREEYFIAVVSARANTDEGTLAIKQFLLENGIEVDMVTHQKPPAIVYIDDRAICFKGSAEGLVDQVRTFKAWNE